jgi:hypothetical protein
MIMISAVKWTAARALVATSVLALTACGLPFGLDQPTTRSLETGASQDLGQARTFEIAGTYAEAARQWSIDLQVIRPGTEHVVLSAGDLKLEAIVIGKDAYFRGQQFLAQHLDSDPQSRELARAAGNAWWKGSPSVPVPPLPDFTDGTAFGSTFLGPALNQRSDNASVDGVGAVRLAGPRADVFIEAAAPHHLLRVHLRPGALVDGMAGADLIYRSYNRDFGIAAPTDVIDFSNLSTLPPAYTVISVDTSACASRCIVSAQVKNLGGPRPAVAPSTVTFNMTEAVSGKLVGSCKVPVRPDVGYGSITSVSCVIDGVAGSNTAIVTATADNPGRG